MALFFGDCTWNDPNANNVSVSFLSSCPHLPKSLISAYEAYLLKTVTSKMEPTVPMYLNSTGCHGNNMQHDHFGNLDLDLDLRSNFHI